MKQISGYGCIVAGIVAVLFFSQPASAQRTSSGRSSLRVSSLTNGQSVSAEAFYEIYTLAGYAEAGISADPGKRVVSGFIVDLPDFAVEGGYMCRVAATRSRNLNFYLGGGILAGVELVDPGRKLPDYARMSASHVGFIYGLYARTSLEWFWTRRLGMVVHGSAPVVFGSYRQLFRWNAGVGIKIVI